MARLIAALALAAAPVLPHPQGLPGIVRLHIDGATVTAEWVLAEDDEAALAEHAPNRLDYFLANFRIAGCSPQGDYRFDCDRPPTTLHVTSTLLLDVDTAYRTLVTVDTGQRTERRFLGNEATTAAVPITDDVGRAERIADEPVTGMPSLERRFVGLLDGPLSLGALVLGLAGAVVVGAVHALSPGHGKSVAAAYLVGAHGRPRHALLLGGIVAAMHTGSVLLLGLGTWYATESVEPGRVLDGLQVVTALLVLGIGMYLVTTRTRHERHHRSGHHHTHGAAEQGRGTPFSRTGLVALGLSGGLLPSPSALVVLLAGLSAGRVGLALALVGAFSIGLAGAVAVAGIAVLKGRDLVDLRGSRWLPVIAAYAVLLSGVGLTVAAFA